jgi:hypothetical protein
MTMKIRIRRIKRIKKIRKIKRIKDQDQENLLMRTMLVLPVTLHQILSALIKGNIRFTNQFTKTKAIETCIILLID